MSDDRFDRQRRLREVGEHGQQRIERSAARIASGPSARVALAYLIRAGVEASVVTGSAGPSAHAALFRFSGPKVVATGAHVALTHLLETLENR